MPENRVNVDGDAIALIQNTAVQAAKATLLTVPGASEHEKYIAHPDGTISPLVLEPQPRRYQLGSLSAFVEFAKAACEGKFGDGKPIVWYNENSVSILLDETNRRDIAHLPLNYTPQFAVLKEGVPATPHPQAGMVRLLRFDLAGVLPSDGLLARMRQVKFTGDSLVEGDLRHGKESMGKAINAQVLGTDTLPETVTLSVRVFDDCAVTLRCDVVCGLDVLVHEQQFRLVPLPMELKNAIDRTLDSIGAELDLEVNCHVYRGYPGQAA